MNKKLIKDYFHKTIVNSQWDSFPTVSLKAKVNGLYVTAGNQPLIASKKSVTS